MAILASLNFPEGMEDFAFSILDFGLQSGTSWFFVLSGSAIRPGALFRFRHFALRILLFALMVRVRLLPFPRLFNRYLPFSLT
jgi:hypothetical protein